MNLDYHNIKLNAIGLVWYYEEKILPMSEEQKRKIVDQDSRAAMYALVQDSLMNPGKPVDVQQEFLKSRKQGSQRADDLRKLRVEECTYHQVGQKESIEDLLNIERNESFRGWFNPDLVSLLVEWKNEESN